MKIAHGYQVLTTLLNGKLSTIRGSYSGNENLWRQVIATWLPLSLFTDTAGALAAELFNTITQNLRDHRICRCSQELPCGISSPLPDSAVFSGRGGLCYGGPQALATMIQSGT
ncbi:hypothetical protein K504DRAFT_504721 [Pleomassaria siparia CBS 279.74]|uniref:Uncharacterized protein n=1 Tax=Pleomassaria siparia CBS 279.74 TaxID=1314801 RepID=A0A6G1K159_9PLEO|nr:hypothetical protein K504DRAFT_504721 [Pleomassaria siparia CBS 279.74]